MKFCKTYSNKNKLAKDIKGWDTVEYKIKINLIGNDRYSYSLFIAREWYEDWKRRTGNDE